MLAGETVGRALSRPITLRCWKRPRTAPGAASCRSFPIAPRPRTSQPTFPSCCIERAPASSNW